MTTEVADAPDGASAEHAACAEGVETSRTALQEAGVLEASKTGVQAGAQYERHAIAPEIGQGWVDFYQVSHGIVVGRSQYDLHPHSSMDTYMEGAPGYFALACIHSGKALWQHKGMNSRECLPNGAALLCPPGAVRKHIAYEWQNARPFSGVCILVPNLLMQELVQEQEFGSIKPHRLMDSETASLLDWRQPSYRQTMHTLQLLMRMAPNTIAGCLQIESLALGLAAMLAGQDAYLLPWQADHQLPYRQRVAVEEACQILQTEFAAPHTIASLARRVHLNECYLKSAFRQATGQTIAAYLRGIRMERARELIEGGRMNVLQASLFVGYANQSIFAAAFKAYYGFTPSRLK